MAGTDLTIGFEQLDADTAQLQSQLNSMVSGLTPPPVKVKIDDADFKKQFDALGKDTPIPLTINREKFDTQLEGITTDLNKLATAEHHIKIDFNAPDVTEFQNTIKGINDAWRKFDPKVTEKNLTLNINISKDAVSTLDGLSNQIDDMLNELEQPIPIKFTAEDPNESLPALLKEIKESVADFAKAVGTIGAKEWKGTGALEKIKTELGNITGKTQNIVFKVNSPEVIAEVDGLADKIEKSMKKINQKLSNSNDKVSIPVAKNINDLMTNYGKVVQGLQQLTKNNKDQTKNITFTSNIEEIQGQIEELQASINGLVYEPIEPAKKSKKKDVTPEVTPTPKQNVLDVDTTPALEKIKGVQGELNKLKEAITINVSLADGAGKLITDTKDSITNIPSERQVTITAKTDGVIDQINNVITELNKISVPSAVVDAAKDLGVVVTDTPVSTPKPSDENAQASNLSNIKADISKAQEDIQSIQDKIKGLSETPVKVSIDSTTAINEINAAITAQTEALVKGINDLVVKAGEAEVKLKTDEATKLVADLQAQVTALSNDVPIKLTMAGVEDPTTDVAKLSQAIQNLLTNKTVNLDIMLGEKGGLKDISGVAIDVDTLSNAIEKLPKTKSSKLDISITGDIDKIKDVSTLAEAVHTQLGTTNTEENEANIPGTIPLDQIVGKIQEVKSALAELNRASVNIGVNFTNKNGTREVYDIATILTNLSNSFARFKEAGDTLNLTVNVNGDVDKLKQLQALAVIIRAQAKEVAAATDEETKQSSGIKIKLDTSTVNDAIKELSDKIDAVNQKQINITINGESPQTITAMATAINNLQDKTATFTFKVGQGEGTIPLDQFGSVTQSIGDLNAKLTELPEGAKEIALNVTVTGADALKDLKGNVQNQARDIGVEAGNEAVNDRVPQIQLDNYGALQVVEAVREKIQGLGEEEPEISISFGGTTAEAITEMANAIKGIESKEATFKFTVGGEGGISAGDLTKVAGNINKLDAALKNIPEGEKEIKLAVTITGNGDKLMTGQGSVETVVAEAGKNATENVKAEIQLSSESASNVIKGVKEQIMSLSEVKPEINVVFGDELTKAIQILSGGSAGAVQTMPAPDTTAIDAVGAHAEDVGSKVVEAGKAGSAAMSEMRENTEAANDALRQTGQASAGNSEAWKAARDELKARAEQLTEIINEGMKTEPSRGNPVWKYLHYTNQDLKLKEFNNIRKNFDLGDFEEQAKRYAEYIDLIERATRLMHGSWDNPALNDNAERNDVANKLTPIFKDFDVGAKDIINNAISAVGEQVTQTAEQVTAGSEQIAKGAEVYSNAMDKINTAGATGTTGSENAVGNQLAEEAHQVEQTASTVSSIDLSPVVSGIGNVEEAVKNAAGAIDRLRTALDELGSASSGNIFNTISASINDISKAIGTVGEGSTGNIISVLGEVSTHIEQIIGSVNDLGDAIKTAFNIPTGSIPAVDNMNTSVDATEDKVAEVSAAEKAIAVEAQQAADAAMAAMSEAQQASEQASADAEQKWQAAFGSMSKTFKGASSIVKKLMGGKESSDNAVAKYLLGAGVDKGHLQDLFSGLSGAGSLEDKVKIIRELLSLLDSASQKYGADAPFNFNVKNMDYATNELEHFKKEILSVHEITEDAAANMQPTTFVSAIKQYITELRKMAVEYENVLKLAGNAKGWGKDDMSSVIWKSLGGKRKQLGMNLPDFSAFVKEAKSSSGTLYEQFDRIYKYIQTLQSATLNMQKQGGFSKIEILKDISADTILQDMGKIAKLFEEITYYTSGSGTKFEGGLFDNLEKLLGHPSNLALAGKLDLSQADQLLEEAKAASEIAEGLKQKYDDAKARAEELSAAAKEAQINTDSGTTEQATVAKAQQDVEAAKAVVEGLRQSVDQASADVGQKWQTAFDSMVVAAKGASSKISEMMKGQKGPGTAAKKYLMGAGLLPDSKSKKSFKDNVSSVQDKNNDISQRVASLINILEQIQNASDIYNKAGNTKMSESFFDLTHLKEGIQQANDALNTLNELQQKYDEAKTHAEELAKVAAESSVPAQEIMSSTIVEEAEEIKEAARIKTDVEQQMADTADTTTSTVGLENIKSSIDEVKTAVEGATNAIDLLKAALEGLSDSKTGGALSTISESIKNISTAIGSFEEGTNGSIVDTLTQMAAAVDNLGKSSSNADFVKTFGGLPQTISSISDSLSVLKGFIDGALNTQPATDGATQTLTHVEEKSQEAADIVTTSADEINGALSTTVPQAEHLEQALSVAGTGESGLHAESDTIREVGQSADVSRGQVEQLNQATNELAVKASAPSVYAIALRSLGESGEQAAISMKDVKGTLDSLSYKKMDIFEKAGRDVDNLRAEINDIVSVIKGVMKDQKGPGSAVYKYLKNSGLFDNLSLREFSVIEKGMNDEANSVADRFRMMEEYLSMIQRASSEYKSASPAKSFVSERENLAQYNDEMERFRELNKSSGINFDNMSVESYTSSMKAAIAELDTFISTYEEGIKGFAPKHDILNVARLVGTDQGLTDKQFKALAAEAKTNNDALYEQLNRRVEYAKMLRDTLEEFEEATGDFGGHWEVTNGITKYVQNEFAQKYVRYDPKGGSKAGKAFYDFIHGDYFRLDGPESIKQQAYEYAAAYADGINRYFFEELSRRLGAPSSTEVSAALEEARSRISQIVADILKHLSDVDDINKQKANVLSSASSGVTGILQIGQDMSGLLLSGEVSDEASKLGAAADEYGTAIDKLNSVPTPKLNYDEQWAMQQEVLDTAARGIVAQLYTFRTAIEEFYHDYPDDALGKFWEIAGLADYSKSGFIYEFDVNPSGASKQGVKNLASFVDMLTKVSANNPRLPDLSKIAQMFPTSANNIAKSAITTVEAMEEETRRQWEAEKEEERQAWLTAEAERERAEAIERANAADAKRDITQAGNGEQVLKDVQEYSEAAQIKSEADKQMSESTSTTSPFIESIKAGVADVKTAVENVKQAIDDLKGALSGLNGAQSSDAFKTISESIMGISKTIGAFAEGSEGSIANILTQMSGSTPKAVAVDLEPVKSSISEVKEEIKNTTQAVGELKGALEGLGVGDFGKIFQSISGSISGISKSIGTIGEGKTSDIITTFSEMSGHIQQIKTDLNELNGIFKTVFAAPDVGTASIDNIDSKLDNTKARLTETGDTGATAMVEVRQEAEQAFDAVEKVKQEWASRMQGITSEGDIWTSARDSLKGWADSIDKIIKSGMRGARGTGTSIQKWIEEIGTGVHTSRYNDIKNAIKSEDIETQTKAYYDYIKLVMELEEASRRYAGSTAKVTNTSNKLRSLFEGEEFSKNSPDAIMQRITQDIDALHQFNAALDEAKAKMSEVGATGKTAMEEIGYGVDATVKSVGVSGNNITDPWMNVRDAIKAQAEWIEKDLSSLYGKSIDETMQIVLGDPFKRTKFAKENGLGVDEFIAKVKAGTGSLEEQARLWQQYVNLILDTQAGVTRYGRGTGNGTDSANITKSMDMMVGAVDGYKEKVGDAGQLPTPKLDVDSLSKQADVYRNVLEQLKGYVESYWESLRHISHMSTGMEEVDGTFMGVSEANVYRKIRDSFLESGLDKKYRYPNGQDEPLSNLEVLKAYIEDLKSSNGTIQEQIKNWITLGNIVSEGFAKAHVDAPTGLSEGFQNVADNVQGNAKIIISALRELKAEMKSVDAMPASKDSELSEVQIQAKADAIEKLKEKAQELENLFGGTHIGALGAAANTGIADFQKMLNLVTSLDLGGGALDEQLKGWLKYIDVLQTVANVSGKQIAGTDAAGSIGDVAKQIVTDAMNMERGAEQIESASGKVQSSIKEVNEASTAGATDGGASAQVEKTARGIGAFASALQSVNADVFKSGISAISGSVDKVRVAVENTTKAIGDLKDALSGLNNNQPNDVFNTISQSIQNVSKVIGTFAEGTDGSIVKTLIDISGAVAQLKDATSTAGANANLDETAHKLGEVRAAEEDVASGGEQMAASVKDVEQIATAVSAISLDDVKLQFKSVVDAIGEVVKAIETLEGSVKGIGHISLGEDFTGAFTKMADAVDAIKGKLDTFNGVFGGLDIGNVLANVPKEINESANATESSGANLTSSLDGIINGYQTKAHELELAIQNFGKDIGAKNANDINDIVDDFVGIASPDLWYRFGSIISQSKDATSLEEKAILAQQYFDTLSDSIRTYLNAMNAAPSGNQFVQNNSAALGELSKSFDSIVSGSEELRASMQDIIPEQDVNAVNIYRDAISKLNEQMDALEGKIVSNYKAKSKRGAIAGAVDEGAYGLFGDSPMYEERYKNFLALYNEVHKKKIDDSDLYRHMEALHSYVNLLSDINVKEPTRGKSGFTGAFSMQDVWSKFDADADKIVADAFRKVQSMSVPKTNGITQATDEVSAGTDKATASVEKFNAATASANVNPLVAMFTAMAQALQQAGTASQSISLEEMKSQFDGVLKAIQDVVDAIGRLDGSIKGIGHVSLGDDFSNTFKQIADGIASIDKVMTGENVSAAFTNLANNIHAASEPARELQQTIADTGANASAQVESEADAYARLKAQVDEVNTAVRSEAKGMKGNGTLALRYVTQSGAFNEDEIAKFKNLSKAIKDGTADINALQDYINMIHKAYDAVQSAGGQTSFVQSPLEKVLGIPSQGMEQLKNDAQEANKVADQLKATVGNVNASAGAIDLGNIDAQVKTIVEEISKVATAVNNLKSSIEGIGHISLGDDFSKVFKQIADGIASINKVLTNENVGTAFSNMANNIRVAVEPAQQLQQAAAGSGAEAAAAVNSEAEAYANLKTQVDAVNAAIKTEAHGMKGSGTLAQRYVSQSGALSKDEITKFREVSKAIKDGTADASAMQTYIDMVHKAYDATQKLKGEAANAESPLGKLFVTSGANETADALATVGAETAKIADDINKVSNTPVKVDTAAATSDVQHLNDEVTTLHNNVSGVNGKAEVVSPEAADNAEKTAKALGDAAANAEKVSAGARIADLPASMQVNIKAIADSWGKVKKQFAGVEKELGPGFVLNDVTKKFDSVGIAMDKLSNKKINLNTIGNDIRNADMALSDLIDKINLALDSKNAMKLVSSRRDSFVETLKKTDMAELTDEQKAALDRYKEAYNSLYEASAKVATSQGIPNKNDVTLVQELAGKVLELAVAFEALSVSEKQAADQEELVIAELTGDQSLDIKNLKKAFGKLGGENGLYTQAKGLLGDEAISSKASVSLDEIIQKYNTLSQLMEKLNKPNPSTAATDIENIRTALQSLTTDLKNIIQLSEPADKPLSDQYLNTLQLYHNAINKFNTALRNSTQARTSMSQESQDARKAIESEKAHLEDLNRQFQAGEISASDFSRSIKEARANLQSNINVLRQNGDYTRTLGERFRDLVKSFSTWFSATRLVMYAVRSIKNMVTTAIQLDDAMTQMEIVTHANAKAMSDFADSAAKAAKEVGSSITDFVSSATVFARLGYDMEESSELARITSMLSNVGDIEVKDAQDAMTAIIKAFDIDASDIESVADKLVTVGNMVAQQYSNILKVMGYIGQRRFGAVYR